MKTKVCTLDGFDIYFEALRELDSCIDLMEPEDAQQTLAQINSGDLVLFCAKVSAEKSGIELGTDYLGGCIYESEESFYTTYKDDYFADMVQNAIQEAKEALPELIKSLSE